MNEKFIYKKKKEKSPLNKNERREDLSVGGKKAGAF